MNQGIHDMITDATLRFGNKTTKRYKHAQNVYDRVVDKYGKESLISTGHSLGSSWAEEVGENKKTRFIR